MAYTDEQFIQALSFLLREIKDVKAQGEALRFLCEKAGTFDHATYQEVYGEALQQFDRAVADALEHALGAAKAAAIQKLLEMPTGRPQ